MTSHDTQQVLMYNESRSFEWQGDITNVIKRLMGIRAKIYAKVTYVNGHIHVKREMFNEKW